MGNVLIPVGNVLVRVYFIVAAVQIGSLEIILIMIIMRSMTGLWLSSSFAIYASRVKEVDLAFMFSGSTDMNVKIPETSWGVTLFLRVKTTHSVGL